MAYADGNIIIGTSVDVGGMNTGLHKIQKSMKRLGAIATVGLSAGLYKLSRTAIDAASNLQEIQNVVDVAFKDMSYKIEEFSKVCIKAFGMSELSAKETAGSFMAMGASIGLTQEAASTMAVELTGLTGDFASFYNISQKYARVAMSAVYTGETETLKKYGIILTAVNLQEYANSIGIQKKVKAMSAEEKVLLRYNYIMEATNNMHNDFERTQHSWANTVRVLTENWNALMAAMGAGLIKVFQPIVEVLSIIVQKLLAIIRYVNELLGIMYETEDVEFAQEMEDTADALDDAAKAAKTMLAPFDKLNNITSSSTKSAKSDADVLEELYDRMGLAGYVIDKLKNLSVQVEEISEQTKTKLRLLVAYFKRAVTRIKELWNDIKLGNWFSVGTDIGEITSSIQQFLINSINKVNWTEIGTDIGKFFEGIIWSDALGGWVDVLTTALNAVLDLAIAGINQISINDIIKLAKNYSKAARKILRWMINAFKKVDWKELGEKIGTFFANLDWKGILTDVAEVFWEALKAVLSAYAGIFDAAPVATALITSIVAAIKIAQWVGLSDALSTGFKKAVSEWKNSAGIAGMASVFRAAMGVVSLGLSIGLIVDTITDIAVGDIEAGSFEAMVKNFIASVGTAFGVVSIAGLFGLSLGPGGFVLTAGITFLITSIIDAVVDLSDEDKLRKAREEALEKLSNISWWREFDEQKEIVINLGIEAQGDLDEVDSTISYYEDLAKRWVELSGKVDSLTESEKNMLKFYADEMSAYFPELEGKINKVTGAYEGEVAQLQLIIDKTKEQMLLQTYQDLEVEYQQKLVEASKERYEYEKKISNLQELWKDYIEYRPVGETSTKPGALAYNIASYLKNNFAALFYDADYQELANRVKLYLTSAIEEGASGINIDGVKIDFSDIKMDFTSELDDETLWDYLVALDEAQKGMDKYDRAVEQAYNDIEHFRIEQALLQDSISNKTLQTKLNNLTDLFNNAFSNTSSEWTENVSSAIDEILDELEKGTPISQEKVSRLNSIIAHGLEDLPDGQMKQDLIATLNQLWSALNTGKLTASDACSQIADAMTKAFSDGLAEEPTIEDATKGAFKSLQDVIKEKQLQVKKSMKTTGRYIVEGYIDGVDESLSDAKKAGADIVKVTEDGVIETGDIGSPAKAFMPLGGYVVAGYVEGMLDNISMISDAAEQIIDDTVDSFADMELEAPISFLPKLGKNGYDVPDIANGLVIPASIEATQKNPNSISSLTSRDLQSMIENAIKNLTINATFNVEGDPYNIFKVVDEQATIYTNRTGRPAFQG